MHYHRRAKERSCDELVDGRAARTNHVVLEPLNIKSDGLVNACVVPFVISCAAVVSGAVAIMPPIPVV
jgi:hypothetical protein